MPVIELGNFKGIIEGDGKVRCKGCINDWKNEYDANTDTIIRGRDLENEEKIYVCDYCGRHSDDWENPL